MGRTLVEDTSGVDISGEDTSGEDTSGVGIDQGLN